ncbi:MAG: chorismate synthase [Deltaproteobacteria bacterium]|nr:MAG: chorismate synthase [Deltaproteobacteria bacterium]
MAGNAFGEIFRITTFGESHGPGVGVIVDGCPPRIALSAEDFVRDMARRRPGKRSFESSRKEKDQVEILSGVFEGLTTGTPIALFIRNRDADSSPYEILRRLFRPGHADYTYYRKYGHFDFRGGGRASARETAARVAAGVVAGKIIGTAGISATAYTLELGGIRAKDVDLSRIGESPFYCPDPAASQQMEDLCSRVRKEGDSVGGIVEVRITGCPAGLGEPVFDKLEADLAKAIMSVGAVKGMEVGAGFAAARLKGSENNDPLTANGFASNQAGGILGGISNGDEIILRAAVKPIPSISLEQDTIDREGRPAKLKITGRHDATAIPRIIPVLEAMVKIVLADHYLRFRTINHFQGGEK